MEGKKPIFCTPFLNPLASLVPSPPSPVDAVSLVTTRTAAAGGGGEWVGGVGRPLPPQPLLQLGFQSLLTTVVAGKGLCSSSADVGRRFEGGGGGGGGGREAAADVEEVRRLFSLPSSNLQPPSDCSYGLGTSNISLGTSDLISMIPDINEAWRSEILRYSYACQGFPCENGRSANALPNLKRKIDSWGCSSEFDPPSLHKESSSNDKPDTPYENLGFQYSPLGVSSRPQSNISTAILKDPQVIDKVAKETGKKRDNNQNKRRSGDASETNLFPPSRRKIVHQNNEKRMAWSLLPCGIDPIFSQIPRQMLIPPNYSERNSLGTYTAADFCTPINEKELEERGLEVVLKKELKKSDVSSLGRIVLPKKEAEANLPELMEKDGLIMHIGDLVFPVIWTFKYRYWPNNKSRMYVMENTGDFIRMHGLRTGDFFLIYREQDSGNYIARGKKEMGRSTSCSRDPVEQNGNSRRNAEEGRCSNYSIAQSPESGNNLQSNQQMHVEAYPF